MNVDPSTNPNPAPKGQWLRMTVMGLVILVCGMLIGGAITSRFAWKRFVDRVRHHDRISERIADHMHHDLDLNQEQRAQIQEIIHQHQTNLMSINREVQPKVDEELEQMRTKVESVLNPEQAKRWNARMKEMREHWRPGMLPHKDGFRPMGKGRRRFDGQGRRHRPYRGNLPPDSLRPPPPPEDTVR